MRLIPNTIEQYINNSTDILREVALVIVKNYCFVTYWNL
jgi:hypothetical protein